MTVHEDPDISELPPAPIFASRPKVTLYDKIAYRYYVLFQERDNVIIIHDSEYNSIPVSSRDNVGNCF